jgi:hypothetical protein
MSELLQADLLRYPRAETANQKVLALLEQVAPMLPLHDRALALSRELDSVLTELLRTLIETDVGPV